MSWEASFYLLIARWRMSYNVRHLLNAHRVLGLDPSAQYTASVATTSGAPKEADKEVTGAGGGV